MNTHLVVFPTPKPYRQVSDQLRHSRTKLASTCSFPCLTYMHTFVTSHIHCPLVHCTSGTETSDTDSSGIGISDAASGAENISAIRYRRSDTRRRGGR